MREGSALLIPDLSPPPPQTCLDFDQDKNVARRGKVLKLKRSGLGPTGERAEIGSKEDALPHLGTSISGGPPTACTDAPCPPAGGETHGGAWSGPEVRERAEPAEVWPQLYRAPSWPYAARGALGKPSPSLFPTPALPHQPELTGSSHWPGGLRPPN